MGIGQVKMTSQVVTIERVVMEQEVMQSKGMTSHGVRKYSVAMQFSVIMQVVMIEQSCHLTINYPQKIQLL